MSSKSKCCTCGYEWITGQSGSHSCNEKLRKDLDKAIELLKNASFVMFQEGLEYTSHEIDEFLKDIEK